MGMSSMRAMRNTGVMTRTLEAPLLIEGVTETTLLSKPPLEYKSPAILEAVKDQNKVVEGKRKAALEKANQEDRWLKLADERRQKLLLDTDAHRTLALGLETGAALADASGGGVTRQLEFAPDDSKRTKAAAATTKRSRSPESETTTTTTKKAKPEEDEAKPVLATPEEEEGEEETQEDVEE